MLVRMQDFFKDFFFIAISGHCWTVRNAGSFRFRNDDTFSIWRLVEPENVPANKGLYIRSARSSNSPIWYRVKQFRNLRYATHCLLCKNNTWSLWPVPLLKISPANFSVKYTGGQRMCAVLQKFKKQASGIVLYCIVLYCIALHCILLYCIVLHCIVEFNVAYHLTRYRSFRRRGKPLVRATKLFIRQHV